MVCPTKRKRVKSVAKSSARSTQTREPAEKRARGRFITAAFSGIEAKRLPGNAYFGEIRIQSDEFVGKMLSEGFSYSELVDHGIIAKRRNKGRNKNGA